MEPFSDVMVLLAEHQWIFDFKLTQFFTEQVWTSAPAEWQAVFQTMTCDELAGIPFGHVKDHWPETLNRFVKGCLQYSMPRQQWKSECTNPVSKSDIDSAIVRGMTDKKLHEVRHMTSLVDHVTRLSGSNCVVDVGSGLGYLGQVLHTRFGHNVLGLEGKGSHTSGAERRTVSESVFQSLQNKTCELYQTRESQEGFLSLLSDWFSQLPPDGGTCRHMTDISHQKHKSAGNTGTLDYNLCSKDHQFSNLYDKFGNRSGSGCEFVSKGQNRCSDIAPHFEGQTQYCDKMTDTNKDIQPPPYQKIDPELLKLGSHQNVAVSDSKWHYPVTIPPHLNIESKKKESESYNCPDNRDSVMYPGEIEGGQSIYRPAFDSSTQNTKLPTRKLIPQIYEHGQCCVDTKPISTSVEPTLYSGDEICTELPHSKTETKLFPHAKLHADIPVTKNYVMPKVYDSDELYTDCQQRDSDSTLYENNPVCANKTISTVENRTYNSDEVFTFKEATDMKPKFYNCDKMYTEISNKDKIPATASKVYENTKTYTDTLTKGAATNFYPSDRSAQVIQQKVLPAMVARRETPVSHIEPRVCMVGLHCCGDLTPTMLRYFTEVECVRSLCCVSCCYHRMSFNDVKKQFSHFPMSKEVGLAYSQIQTQFPRFQFNSYSMRLAAQETRARWQSQTASDHDFHVRNVAYRGILELCLQTGSFVLEKSARKLAHRQDHESFDRYIDAVVKHLQVPDTGNPQDHVTKFKRAMASHYDEYKQYFVYIEPITALQVLLQPVLETLIHTDRQTWLQEQGLQARLVPVFDDFISPRNMALVAVKDPSDHH